MPFPLDKGSRELPTLAGLAGAPVTDARTIDGRDRWPVLANQPTAEAPHDALLFYWNRELHAVRSGRWKLHLPHPYQSLDVAGNEGSRGKYSRKEIGLSLFDLEKDAGETTDVSARNPAVVQKLLEHAERAREDLGDSLTGRTGKNIRTRGSM